MTDRPLPLPPEKWRTPADVQPILARAAACVAVGDVDGAVAVLVPKVYDPQAQASPINRLSLWGAWRQIAQCLAPIAAQKARLTRPADVLAVEMVLGTAYERLYDYPSARPYLDNALELARAQGDAAAECFILGRFGNIVSSEGDQQAGLDMYNTALSIARRVGNRVEEGTLLNNIGVIYKDMGRLRHAITYYEQAWKIAQRTHDAYAEAWYVWCISNSLIGMGDYAAALTFAERTLPRAQRVGEASIVAGLINNKAECLARVGREAEAQALYRQSLALGAKGAGLRETIFAHVGLALLALQQGDMRTARAEIARGDSDIALVTEVGATQTEIILPLVRAKAQVAQAEGNTERAQAYYTRLQVVAAESTAAPFEAWAWIGLAGLAQEADAATAALVRAYTLMADSEHRARKDVLQAVKQLLATQPAQRAALPAPLVAEVG